MVLQSEHLSSEAAAWLAERCRLVACAYDDAKFDAELARADALVVRTYTIVNESLLKKSPRLRVVGRAGVGLDNIDVNACRARGVEVVYTPDANTQAVVEYVLFLIGDAIRPRQTIDRAVDAGAWRELRETHCGKRELAEMTIGILGLGRIGKCLTAVLTALGCRVLYYDLMNIPPAERSGGEPVDAQTLFREANVLSVHIDGRPSNAVFISAPLLNLMKRDVLFINTSRGLVVDSGALAAFMRKHEAARATLDVHEPEPFTSDYPLLGLPNVRLLPHIASRTDRAMLNMSWVVRDVVEVLEGRSPQFPAPA
jgi:D-3-phosphoglycerate dehydrogenase